MLYIYPIPIGMVASIIYIVGKQWDLKMFAKISKIILISSIVFFILSYITFLGFNIPIISNLLNSIKV